MYRATEKTQMNRFAIDGYPVCAERERENERRRAVYRVPDV